MRISQGTKLRAEKARELFKEYGNLTRVSRELGIHRSTLDRWRAAGLLESNAGQGSAISGIDDLVSKALKVIDQALEGEKITPNQIRAAIEVTKASNALRAQAKAEEAKQSLAELIAQEEEGESD